MKLHELQAALGRAVDELGTEAIIADPKLYEAKEAEIAEIQGKIDRASKAQQRAANLARPVAADTDAPAETGEGIRAIRAPSSLVLDGTAESRRNWNEDQWLRAVRQALDFKPVLKAERGGHFDNFGEQLLAVARYKLSRDPGALDPRLVRAPTGAGEVDPSAGGFLVQNDFSTAIFMRLYEMGQVLSRVRKLSISTVANSIKIPAVDETSRATGSRWGGVQSYWVGEGQTATATKPKFRLVELDLKKLLANWYVSDELLADSSVVNSIANEAFSEELTFMTEDAIFRGDGAGKPLGFINSPAKVSVAKESGQASKTIVYENVVKMWSRMWARSRANAVWFINQDVEPQLYTMSQVIGTAGVPVYLPANGISGQPYGTLFGRPVIAVEYADTVGNEGDISFVDLSQFVLADKGGVQAASSMHVNFLQDEMVFRITYRVDGQPIWHSALTPYKGANTLSPFITLAAR